MRRIPRGLLIGAISLVVSTPSAAQGRGPTPGLSPAGRVHLDAYLQGAVDSGWVAGASALVLRDGMVLYERAVGWADREAGRRMNDRTLFRIASQTKSITSVAVMMLVDEGKMALTDPVARWLPDFATTTVLNPADSGRTTVPARRPITIFDLLTHTAGLSYGTDGAVAERYRAAGLGPAAGFGWYTADKDEPICASMARLATLPFVAQPGERFVYGYNTDLLGCLVERASGLPLDRFLRERITAPLGMTDTHFFLPPSDRDRLAVVYRTGEDGRVARADTGARGQGHYVDGPRRSFAGGAGLVSTPRDYARFLEMLRQGGVMDGRRYLSAESARRLTTNQAGALFGREGRGLSLAFETVEAAGPPEPASAGSYGWGGAYGTVYTVDPAERLVMVFMLQTLPNRAALPGAFKGEFYRALRMP